MNLPLRSCRYAAIRSGTNQVSFLEKRTSEFRMHLRLVVSSSASAGPPVGHRDSEDVAAPGFLSGEATPSGICFEEEALRSYLSMDRGVDNGDKLDEADAFEFKLMAGRH